MIILIRKRVLAGLFCCFIGCFALTLWQGHRKTVPAFAARNSVPLTIVIDPGHGGEDGGAVSSGGLPESNLNLAVSMRLNDLFRLMGQQTVLTRTEDAALDGGEATVHQRKRADLKKRVAIVNSMENAVLISIHQNSLPSSPRTHGAQVFWNRREGAEELALLMQEALNQCVNIGSEKQSKPIPSTIYLMKYAEAPAVLVECGFLSNPSEAERLQDPSHQTLLAAAVTAGFLRCMAEKQLLPSS